MGHTAGKLRLPTHEHETCIIVGEPRATLPFSSNPNAPRHAAPAFGGLPFAAPPHFQPTENVYTARVPPTRFVVRVLVGRLDESTCDANGLRTSGSLGGKVGERR